MLKMVQPWPICLLSLVASTNFTEKNNFAKTCGLQQDFNPYRQSIRRAHWPSRPLALFSLLLHSNNNCSITVNFIIWGNIKRCAKDSNLGQQDCRQFNDGLPTLISYLFFTLQNNINVWKYIDSSSFSQTSKLNVHIAIIAYHCEAFLQSVFRIR